MTKKEILVIVAHPDDETIWMGGTLLKIKEKEDSNVTIISLCRKNDIDRYPRFEKSCKMLGAKEYHMSDLDDCEEGAYKKISNHEIIEKIFEFTQFNGKNYDSLYTHGENGEYGHIRHIEAHRAICEMLDKKLVLAKQVVFFSYIKTKENSNINSNADKLIKLENPYFKMKKQLIKEVYGFKEGSFEYESARDVEAFDIKK
jgi:LmbE family N-acetylglucosaminyl deacetylase